MGTPAEHWEHAQAGEPEEVVFLWLNFQAIETADFNMLNTLDEHLIQIFIIKQIVAKIKYCALLCHEPTAVRELLSERLTRVDLSMTAARADRTRRRQAALVSGPPTPT
jgi:hypothetical protein